MWWRNRPIRTLQESACLFAALFAAEARRRGDRLDYYRWRVVLNDLQRDLPDPRQLSIVAE